MDINELENRQRKSTKLKFAFFGNFNTSDKPLSRLIKENQCIHIRNERGDSTTDPTSIKNIIRRYYEKLYGNKLSNLDEMGKFPEKHNETK